MCPGSNIEFARVYSTPTFASTLKQTSKQNLSVGTGHRRVSPAPSDRYDWDGRQAARQGDRIGLLLDLEEGTLTVYKNGERLGVISREMQGRFCWAAYWCPTYSMSEGETVRIARKPVPQKNAAVMLS